MLSCEYHVEKESVGESIEVIAKKNRAEEEELMFGARLK